MHPADILVMDWTLGNLDITMPLPCPGQSRCWSRCHCKKHHSSILVSWALLSMYVQRPYIAHFFIGMHPCKSAIRILCTLAPDHSTLNPLDASFLLKPSIINSIFGHSFLILLFNKNIFFLHSSFINQSANAELCPLCMALYSGCHIH